MSIIDKVLASFGPEDKAQYAVVRYAESKGYRIWHVPNNTYTKSIMQKIRNKLLGVRPGVPDLFFIANNRLAVIEMKSLTGSATKEQRDYIDALNNANVPAIVAKGAEPAIDFIDLVAAGTINSGNTIKTKETAELITGRGDKFKITLDNTSSIF